MQPTGYECLDATGLVCVEIHFARVAVEICLRRTEHGLLRRALRMKTWEKDWKGHGGSRGDYVFAAF